MLDVNSLMISGMQWHEEHLWLACPEDSLVAAYDPARGTCEHRLSCPGVEHACPTAEGIWLQTSGGKLGRQLVLWSPRERQVRRFDCPDGAASGMTLVKGKIWLSHRRNRKLFCMDPANGELLWTIRTEHQLFAPTEYNGQLWAVECDPGPLGEWSDESQAIYCFVRFDPVHERVVERYRAPSAPRCLALTGDRFWYAVETCPGPLSTPAESLGRSGAANRFSGLS